MRKIASEIANLLLGAGITVAVIVSFWLVGWITGMILFPQDYIDTLFNQSDPSCVAYTCIFGFGVSLVLAFIYAVGYAVRSSVRARKGSK